MRMVRHRRAPGVKHRSDADAGAQVLGIGRDGDHGLGRGREQDVVDRGLVLIRDVRNGPRQREHHVEVRHRKQIGLARGEPFRGGGALALGAMRVNRFFSSVIRIQTDRGQRVVTTGPYAFVRHPGYTAGILVIVASGPALGSWLAAALVVIFSLPFLLYRTTTEDQILQVELAGYSDYATRVRWRLLPGIW